MDILDEQGITTECNNTRDGQQDTHTKDQVLLGSVDGKIVDYLMYGFIIGKTLLNDGYLLCISDLDQELMVMGARDCADDHG
ncbi:predicted protein [Lichtheimia corymbifera JMRC:FSU:9682]|uniref:Uncharacterized protein n=1 Tax=Lichtheimia corymbifera JMRC:FSU:9682 TaxID=1263082 RepID=A0A068SCX8_9FUNG|nr:predicted protein [Lichtheimia corymbifera JMRC:FSU:9682]